MKNKNRLLLPSIILSAVTYGNAYAMQDSVDIITKATGQKLSADHMHRLSKNDTVGFNPPRQVSPKQFELLLQNNHSIDDVYLTKHTKTALESKTSDSLTAVSIGCSSPNELEGLTGQALITAVKSGNLTTCLYGLFNSNFVGTSLFSDASIQSIAQGIVDHLAEYDGTEQTGAAELEKLVIYLRAMHWAEWGNNRQFTQEYKDTLKQAFNLYFAGTHFTNFKGQASRNFMVRYEMLILLRSSGTNNIEFLPRLTDALIGYAETVSTNNDWGVYYEENGLTQVLTHLFNASEQQTQALEQAVLANPKIIQNLVDFVSNKGLWLVGHTREYQWGDAVNELSRFLRYGGTIAQSVRPTIQGVLESYSYQGAGSSGWLKAQAAVTHYDAQNCELYGDACSFDLEAAILSGNHVCSTTLKLRFQKPISNENLIGICASLAGQEQEFHQLFNTQSNAPVANDNNEDLEVVIFSSYSDYDNYAGSFFGINTDNGGMYLEGTPWANGNQARFIAHQATWLPDFKVWNLEHEYIHYLDGRFNKWGGFNDQPANTVWWGEGLAEYLSQPNNNPNALAVATQGTYSLSELFQTTYENSDTSRTYYWGYLATRFMMENKASAVEGDLLANFRAPKYVVATGECQFEWSWKLKQEAIENSWYWAYDDSEWSSGSWVWTCGQPEPEDTEVPSFTPYSEILESWGTSFDNEFTQWLVCLVEGEGICSGIEPNPADLDGNNQVDIRDINLFISLLKTSSDIDLQYDFNQDGLVDRRDVRAMMATCDLPRCVISQ
ncbi:collagenase [Thalassotalea marina]|uniref:microbial collagenase n=1 Tax=Thalassotalea marina TaxID=1673741 RepID=A0A919BJ61_9GAMM|nr:collagenase [Thalassotalea marina]GHF92808.1 hypothetical protein GCM10017161_21260 [Thalassotalea marina]